MSPRPHPLDSEVINAVAQKHAPLIIKSLSFNMGEEEVTKDIAQAVENAFSWDGYEIAKELDDMGWRVNAELVRLLDSAGTDAYVVTGKLTEKWVKDNKITPAFKIGDKVKSTRYPIEGEITKICEDMAQYVVFNEALGHVRKGSGTRGRYLNFEEVLPLNNP